MTYNKTLNPADYADWPDEGALFERLRGSITASIQHEHRKWEWCLALNAIQKMGCQTVLEVGSGGSLFAPMAAESGLEVTVVDPDPMVSLAETQGQQIGKHIGWVQAEFEDFADSGPYAEPGRYDAVACLSVLEHVEDDENFVRRLASLTKKILVITTDFSMDGRPFSQYHLRTYSPERLQALADLLPDFELADRPEWTDNGPHIYGQYNFAALVMMRAAKTTPPPTPPRTRRGEKEGRGK